MASANKYFMIASSALSCDYGAQSSILRRMTCQFLESDSIRPNSPRNRLFRDCEIIQSAIKSVRFAEAHCDRVGYS